MTDPKDTISTDDILLAARRMKPKIIVSPLVPDDQIIIMNDLDLPIYRPDTWDAMTAKEQLEWAVDNGMAIVVKNLGVEEPS